ncbi:MAG: hypothetical protein Q7U44_05645 [Desulfuromonadales bacterium]|nr:hypothetical protein [Desulfuromonadales bacterium]
MGTAIAGAGCGVGGGATGLVSAGTVFTGGGGVGEAGLTAVAGGGVVSATTGGGCT